jgi:hypothetical protein
MSIALMWSRVAPSSAFFALMHETNAFPGRFDNSATSLHPRSLFQCLQFASLCELGCTVQRTSRQHTLLPLIVQMIGHLRCSDDRAVGMVP